MSLPTDFKRKKPLWCPGCGDYAILNSLQKAFSDLGLKPHRVVLVAGIGCSGFLWSNYNSNSFKAIHGRVLPVATGIKLANPDLTVIGASGDGDAYSIGGNHLIHTIRRNPNITYIVMDNQVYGNTKGHTSPTAHVGFVTKSTPYGSGEQPVQPMTLALATGISFVAQGFSGHPRQLADLIRRGIQHKGFALINVLSPCVVFNREYTYDWFREHLLNLDEDESHDSESREEAFKICTNDDRVPIGVVYAKERASYQDMLPNLSRTAIVRQDLKGDLARLSRLLEGFS